MQIRPVLLHSVIDSGTTAEHWDLFRQMVELKTKGYQRHYPAGVLPIDTTDFFGSHFLVGRDTPNGFEVLSAYKAVSRSQSDHYLLYFPGLSLVQQARAPEHILKVEEIMASCLKKGRELCYVGSWTVSESAQTDPVLKQELRSVFLGALMRFFKEIKVDEILLGGTPRFRTERLLGGIGFEPLQNSQHENLPLIHVRHLFGEPVQVMHLREMTFEAQRQMKAVEEFWSRLEIHGKNPSSSVVRAA